MAQVGGNSAIAMKSWLNGAENTRLSWLLISCRSNLWWGTWLWIFWPRNKQRAIQNTQQYFHLLSCWKQELFNNRRSKSGSIHGKINKINISGMSKCQNWWRSSTWNVDFFFYLCKCCFTRILILDCYSTCNIWLLKFQSFLTGNCTKMKLVQ